MGLPGDDYGPVAVWWICKTRPTLWMKFEIVSTCFKIIEMSMFLGIRLTSWRLLEITIIFRLSWRIRSGTTAWWICLWQRTFCDIIFSKTKRLEFLGSSIGFFYNFDTFLEFQHLEFSLLKIKRSETELESLTWIECLLAVFPELFCWKLRVLSQKVTKVTSKKAQNNGENTSFLESNYWNLTLPSLFIAF